MSATMNLAMSTDARLVSVIIPAYNMARYLGECLDSLLRQTHSTLEIIVVDDGSTDTTNDLLRRYSELDSRIRTLSTATPRSGPSVARNLGLDHASGEYFCFVDSDDICHPDMICRLLAALDAAPQAMYAVAPFATFSDHIPQQISKRRAVRPSDIRIISGKEGAIAMLYQTASARGLTVSAYSKLFRSTIADRIRFTPGIIYEDLELLPRITARLKAIATLGDILYYYRLHPGSVLGSFSPRRLQVLTVVGRLRRAFAHDAALRRAADTRIFAAAFNMLLHLCVIPRQQAEATGALGHLERMLQLLRSTVVRNPHTRSRDRLGAIIAFLPGISACRQLLRTFPTLTRHLLKR